MADDDQSIWDSVDEPATETVEAPQVESVTEQVETPRDERGRFAPKTAAEQATEQAAQEQPEAPATEQPNRGSIPPYRLKEEADARRAAEERAANNERMLAEMQRQLQALQKQNEPQQPVPDIFEDGAGFVDHRTRAAIEPVKSELQQLREFYSQRDAVRDHGAEKVRAAFVALDQAAKSGDEEARAAVERVKSSMDPFGDIVKWHKKQTVFSTIGDDPESFVERQIEERLKDPTYQAKLLERIRGVAQGRPSTVTPLPPSLNRATSAAAIDGDEDESDAGLLNAALRR